MREVSAAAVADASASAATTTEARAPQDGCEKMRIALSCLTSRDPWPMPGVLSFLYDQSGNATCANVSIIFDDAGIEIGVRCRPLETQGHADLLPRRHVSIEVDRDTRR